MPVGVACPVGRVVVRAGRHGRRLGRSVRALDVGVEPSARVGDERRGHAGAAARHEPEARHAGGVELGRTEQRDEEGWRADHEGDVGLVDAPQRRPRIPARHELGADRNHAGDEHRVEEPGHVRERGGHQHGIRHDQLMRVGHEAGFPRQTALGVQRSLWSAGRPRCEQGDRQVGAARRGPHHGRAGVKEPGDAGRRAAHLLGREEQSGLEHGQHALDLGRSCVLVDRAGDRTQAPAGAVEQDGLVPVRRLPRDHVAAPHTPGAQPAGERGGRGDDPGAVECRRVVDQQRAARTCGRGRQGRVEGRRVPRAARGAVGAGLGVPVGGPQVSGWRHDGPAGVAPRRICDPMKFRWISTVPAPMHSPRMSR